VFPFRKAAAWTAHSSRTTPLPGSVVIRL
jgi:hypothetical protein